MTRDQAIEQIAFDCSASVYPQLDSTSLSRIVDQCEDYTVWTASTAYNVDDVVVSSPFTGRMYRCVKPGTSGTTNPFPDAPSLYQTGCVFGDSADIYWVDCGSASKHRWNVKRGASMGWRQKASMVAQLLQVKDGQQDLQLGNLYKQCLDMANKYNGLEII